MSGKSSGLFSVLPVVFVLLCMLFASCRIDVDYSDGNVQSFEGSASWMSGLPDSTPISSITLPGTHDSCANYDFLGLSSVSANQDLNLKEQLDAGVRCFDIRIYDDNGNYKIHHGPQFMHITLGGVVEECELFLKANPSEYIFMLFQGEYKTPVRGVTEIVCKLVESNPQLFWQGKDADNVTLGEVRGKIIVSFRYRDPDRTCCLDESVYVEGGCRYSTRDTQDSWTQVEHALKNNAENVAFNKPASVFAASYFKGQFGIPNIRISSSFVNEKLQTWLESYRGTGTHFGMIVTNHITRRLAYTIYSCNNLVRN